MPDPKFRIVAVDATNAGHVGAVFRSTYGDDFPVRDVYRPDVLLGEIAAGRLIAGLAIDEEGRVGGYISMFKSAPNPRLWEAGNTIVVPEYAGTDLSFLLAHYCADLIAGSAATADGFFMEAVCSHYFTQVGAAKIGLAVCALELDQLDGNSFKDGRSNPAGTERVSCVCSFMETADPEPPLYAPVRYEGILRKVAASFRPRVFIPSTAPMPSQGATRMEDAYYAPARTWKFAVTAVGRDWSAVTADILDQARGRGVVSLQITLNLALPHLGAAADILRGQGFFFGGMAPHWFGTDGLLMQRLFDVEPQYETMKLYGAMASELLAYIRADRETVREICAHRGAGSR